MFIEFMLHYNNFNQIRKIHYVELFEDLLLVKIILNTFETAQDNM